MELFKQLHELLETGESFALAVIINRSGSAPRAVGTRMAVLRDATIVGTIGGGILEAQVREIAMEVFSARKSALRKFSFAPAEDTRERMICGGEIEVLVHFVDALLPTNQVLYQRIHETIRSGRRALLITEIPSGARESEPLEQSLVENDGTQVGQLDPGIAPALMLRTGLGRPELVSHNENLFFVEPLYQGGTVFIFGAGHISTRLVPLARLVGFRTVVLDDRHEFANRERFQTADEIIVSDSFEQVMNGLKIDEKSYLVLVTRGHAHDKVLLRQALGTKAGYIGMIGSISKRDSTYDALHKEGFSRREFDRVCSPIGLDIGAETPEEIAVSIVAELVGVRAGKNVRGR